MAQTNHSFKTALNLGELSGSLNRKDTVRSAQPDYFRLRLTGRGSFNFALTGLTANADLQLFNAKGRSLARSHQPGTQSELIQRSLEVGTYYLKVSGQQGKTRYQLSVGSSSGTATLGNRWVYQLQNASIAAIDNTPFNLATIDYSRDGSDATRYKATDLAALHRNGKQALAYLSIGEAEEYRYYFDSHWVSGTAGGLKQPDADAPGWLGHTNPDWEGNYKVKYWLPDWQKIIYGYVDKIINAGFDGVYLDIVDGFEYWSDRNNGEKLVLSTADAAHRMIKFVEQIANYARVKSGKSNFAIVPQNAESILAYDTDSSYLKTISGIGVEDLFYDEVRPQPAGETNFRLQWLNAIRAAGKPVYVVDYVDDGSGYQGANQTRIDTFRSNAIAKGYVPYVGRRDRELNTINSIAGVQP
jgi:cysteinyl-tRNA synthetase, unknown class